MWFSAYNRDGQKDSCGFEHVFVGESKGDIITGFHNWIQVSDFGAEKRVIALCSLAGYNVTCKEVKPCQASLRCTCVTASYRKPIHHSAAELEKHKMHPLIHNMRCVQRCSYFR